VLEYGAVYLAENQKILEAMRRSMAPEAYALAILMANEMLAEEEDE
jgi:hypothetical protein